MVLHAVTLHAADGTTVWSTDERFVGTVPWEWAAARDQERVKVAVALCLIRQPTAPVRFEVCSRRYPSGGIQLADAEFKRLPTQEAPLLAITRIYTAMIENLSPREREIAKLMPDYTAKQIGRILKISASTVETHRGRIGLKIGVAGGQLVAWCQEHRDFL